MIAALILVIAATISLYILVGYPLLLSRVEALRPAHPQGPRLPHHRFGRPRGVQRPGVSCQETRQPAELSTTRPDLLDIVVVSDGSTDATDSIVQSYAHRKVRLVRVPHGRKSRRAQRCHRAMPPARFLFFVDVRQMLDPQALRHLVANFADPSVGAVTGELRFVHSDNVGEAADIDVYWKYEIWARQRHSRIDSIFSTTGCIYAMRRSLAEPIPSDTLVDDSFIPVRVFFRGYRVVIDTEALAFDYGVITGGEFRRKLRTLAGVWQVWARLPQLFTSANRMRLHFLPHKFGRVVLPWLILAGLIAALLLPAGPVRSSLLALALAVLVLGRTRSTAAQELHPPSYLFSGPQLRRLERRRAALGDGLLCPAGTVVETDSRHSSMPPTRCSPSNRKTSPEPGRRRSSHRSAPGSCPLLSATLGSAFVRHP